jgi:hypothetical protein
MKYEIVKDDLRNQDTLVRTNDDGTITYIPCDEANSDYQRYLNPEAEQSTPIVIDEAKTK